LVATGITLWSAAARSRNASRVGNTGPISRIGAFLRMSRVFDAGFGELALGKAGSSAGVACGPALMHGDKDRILVAIQCDRYNMLSVARSIAFAPIIASRS